MKIKKLPPLEYLFHFESERSWINSKQFIGKTCGSLSSNDYLQVHINDCQYSIHRIIFFMVYKIEPDGEIDHINQIKIDNRPINLRQATRRQNMVNQSVHKNNKTGIKGVYFYKNKYSVKIRINKILKHVGYFNTKEEAVKAYNKEEEKYHGEFANFNNRR